MLRAVLATTIFILAGCSSQQPPTDETLSHSPNTIEPTAEEPKPTPSPAPSIAFEGGSVILPFEYATTFNRTQETEKFALQRRVFLEIIGGEIGQRSVELKDAMNTAGFDTDYIRENDGVIQGRFSKEGVHNIYTLIRPPGEGPSIREDGAVASLLMTQVIEEH